MYVNPYQNLEGGEWCKTNLHAHAGTAPNTCGATPLQNTVDVYRLFHFDLLAISNHDIFTDTKAYSNEDMVMIPGVEYSKGEHMLTIGVDRSLHEEDHQSAIDITREMGGFTVMAHPNWIKREYWSHEKLMGLTGYQGLEIINMLIYRLNGSGLATDTWDYLLSNGRLIYGFGNDDFHGIHDAARSFNYCYCREKSMKGLKAAVDRGAVCASTGLAPEYLFLEDNMIRVKAKFQTETYVDSFTYRFVTVNGEILHQCTGSEARFQLKDEPYVRVEVIGENGALLFFQPVYRSSFFN